MLTCEWSENPCPGVVDGVCKKACFKPAMRPISDQDIRDAFPLRQQQQTQRQAGCGPRLTVVACASPLGSPSSESGALEGDDDLFASDQGF